MNTDSFEKYEQNPINQLWDDILFLPIVGMVDSARAQDIMDVMLEMAERTGARFAILDIRGVSVVDSAVANHIIKITKSTRLLGCTTILTGVTPAVAQSLVNLGIDLGDISTSAQVRDALQLAFNELGYVIHQQTPA